LLEINEKSNDVSFKLDVDVASTLVTCLSECSEWAQIYILEAIMYLHPAEKGDAESVIDRVIPRLQHSNSGIVLTSTKVIIHLLSFAADSTYQDNIYKKIAPPLLTLLGSEPEIQYVTLRSILLIVQKRPELFQPNLKMFFCKYNDPIYVKISKLEIMFRLVHETNVDILINELMEYSTEVDVAFVRKAVRAIGRCAIKIESSADSCIHNLMELILSKVNYVVQEAVVVIKVFPLIILTLGHFS
jgi:AP-2 complex subunit beta-1